MNKLLGIVALFVVLIGLVAVGYRAYGFVTRAKDSDDSARRSIVTVDVVRIMNAERAVASKMLGQDDTSSATTLTHAGKNVNKAIRAIAGSGAIVLVKQAVVRSGAQVPDITGKVLDRLGLPKNVATVGLPDKANRATRYGNSPAYQSLKKHYDRDKAADNRWRKRAKSRSTDNLIP